MRSHIFYRTHEMHDTQHVRMGHTSSSPYHPGVVRGVVCGCWSSPSSPASSTRQHSQPPKQSIPSEKESERESASANSIFIYVWRLFESELSTVFDPRRRPLVGTSRQTVSFPSCFLLPLAAIQFRVEGWRFCASRVCAIVARGSCERRDDSCAYALLSSAATHRAPSVGRMITSACGEMLLNAFAYGNGATRTHGQRQ